MDKKDKKGNKRGFDLQIDTTKWITGIVDDFEKEFMDKSVKDLKNKEEFFDMFDKLTETRFTDQNNTLKSKVVKFKGALNKFVNETEVVLDKFVSDIET